MKKLRDLFILASSRARFWLTFFFSRGQVWGSLKEALNFDVYAILAPFVKNRSAEGLDGIKTENYSRRKGDERQ